MTHSSMPPSLGERFTQAVAGAAARLGITGEDAPLTLARRFGVGGFVARHWSSGDHPVDYQAEVRARRLFERVLLQTASDVSDVLSRNGIPHCFVKGIVLSQWLYEPGERYFADLDLLLPSDARVPAVGVLRTIGYREAPPQSQSGPVELRPGVTLIKEPARSAMEAVNIDIRWGVEPIYHLLPRDDTPLPDSIWNRLTKVGPIPTPAPEHHAALVLYHLVHHDLLHIRSLLDFALLRQRLSHDSIGEFEKTVRALGVHRPARTIHAALQHDLGLEPHPGLGTPPTDWRAKKLARLLRLEHWLTWAGAATTHEHRAITPSRFVRRLLLLDRLVSARYLLADGVWPPQAFLRWRWPELRSPIVARARHLAAVARKTLTL